MYFQYCWLYISPSLFSLSLSLYLTISIYPSIYLSLTRSFCLFLSFSLSLLWQRAPMWPSRCSAGPRGCLRSHCLKAKETRGPCPPRTRLVRPQGSVPPPPPAPPTASPPHFLPGWEIWEIACACILSPTERCPPLTHKVLVLNITAFVSNREFWYPKETK